MTDVLLDTNAVLWLVSEPDRLSPTTLDILANPGNALYVSAASAWEIAIKPLKIKSNLLSHPIVHHHANSIILLNSPWRRPLRCRGL